MGESVSIYIYIIWGGGSECWIESRESRIPGSFSQQPRKVGDGSPLLFALIEFLEDPPLIHSDPSSVFCRLSPDGHHLVRLHSGRWLDLDLTNDFFRQVRIC